VRVWPFSRMRSTERLKEEQGRSLGCVVISTAIILAQIVLSSPRIDAQSDTKGAPRFDVATIKVNKSHDNGERFGFTVDGFESTNVSLMVLLKLAYGVEEDQIVGLPGWDKSERFDITAKAVEVDLGKLPIVQRKQMIRPLLADRFQLRFHEVEKNIPAYVLVVAKNGPKLQPSKTDGPSPLRDHQNTLRMMGRGYVLGHWGSNGVNSSDAHGSIGPPRNRSHWSRRQLRFYAPLDPG
jgi:hypothetical protein